MCILESDYARPLIVSKEHLLVWPDSPRVPDATFALARTLMDLGRYQEAGPVAAFYWVDDNKGYVVSGPADRDRLLKVAQSIYDQMENRPAGRERS